MRSLRPRLLGLTALAAVGSIVANGVGAVTAATAPAATRLGVAIDRDLAAQSSTAAQRTRRLDLREQAARATEARLKADLAAREATARPGAAPAAPAGEQFDSLARVYQAMKPARAAPVLEQLDMAVQMQVAKRMRDRSTALIMAAMSPKGAADLSMALARKSPLPEPAATRPTAAVAAGAATPPAASGTASPVASGTPPPAPARDRPAVAGSS